MAPDVPPQGVDPAGAFSVSVLRKRADFLRAARAKRVPCSGFLLQARKRQDGEISDTPVRIGFTCSKKVGNAVARNRAKRRLRAIAQEVLPDLAVAGWDYVLIGRHRSTADLPYEQLCSDLRDALRRVHQ